MSFKSLARGAALLCLLAALLAACLWAAERLLRPPPVPAWQPIFRGVDYYAETLKGEFGGSGRAMAVRVDLSAPGVRLQVRPADAPTGQGHYRLAFPDWHLARHGLAVLINTSAFHGEALTQGCVEGARGRPLDFRGWRGWPGRPVYATDVNIIAGAPLFVPERAHLLWFEQDLTPHFDLRPVSAARIQALLAASATPRLHWGVGLPVPQLWDRQILPWYLRDEFRRDAELKPFVGVDRGARRLYLMAFERASTREMLEFARRLGVEAGGQFDAGHTTTLLVGRGARGLPPHTGIRGLRPLAAWLGVQAEPLPEGQSAAR